MDDHNAEIYCKKDRLESLIILTDGREIYFHRNSVSGNGFDPLEKGVIVRIVLDTEERSKGPQASTVM
jgi:cold shock CspA family protein